LVHAFAAEGIEVAARALQIGEPGKPLPVRLLQGAEPSGPGALPR
jgi:hypothetical protein